MTETHLVFKSFVLPLRAPRRTKSRDWGKKRMSLKDAQSSTFWDDPDVGCRYRQIWARWVSHDSGIMLTLTPSASWVRVQSSDTPPTFRDRGKLTNTLTEGRKIQSSPYQSQKRKHLSFQRCLLAQHTPSFVLFIPTVYSHWQSWCGHNCLQKTEIMRNKHSSRK